MENILVHNLVVVTLSIVLVALILVRLRGRIGAILEVHFAKPFREALDSREFVGALIEVGIHAGFLGSAAGPLLGVEDHRQNVLLAIAWALVMVLVVRRLLRLASDLEREDERLRHRRTAGTVRSIVRGELAAANARHAAASAKAHPAHRRVKRPGRCPCCGLNKRER